MSDKELYYTIWPAIDMTWKAITWAGKIVDYTVERIKLHLTLWDRHLRAQIKELQEQWVRLEYNNWAFVHEWVQYDSPKQIAEYIYAQKTL